MNAMQVVSGIAGVHIHHILQNPQTVLREKGQTQAPVFFFVQVSRIYNRSTKFPILKFLLSFY